MKSGIYKDPEKRKAYLKAYYQTHKDVIKEQQRNYYKEHCEHLKEVSRAYYRAKCAKQYEVKDDLS